MSGVIFITKESTMKNWPSEVVHDEEYQRK